MRRCEKHGRYGCTDYDCQRAETARAGGGADNPLLSDDDRARIAAAYASKPAGVLDEEGR